MYVKAESTENYNLEFNGRMEIAKQETKGKSTGKLEITTSITARLFSIFVCGFLFSFCWKMYRLEKY